MSFLKAVLLRIYFLLWTIHLLHWERSGSENIMLQSRKNSCTWNCAWVCRKALFPRFHQSHLCSYGGGGIETGVNLDTTTSQHSNWKSPNSLILNSSFFIWGHQQKGNRFNLKGEFIYVWEFTEVLQLVQRGQWPPVLLPTPACTKSSTQFIEWGGDVLHTAIGKQAAYVWCCFIPIQVSVAWLAAHIYSPTSELENESHCLLTPAGTNEKYHCASTESQCSRRSGEICVPISLFEKAAHISAKSQHQITVYLDPACLEHELGGHQLCTALMFLIFTVL